MSANNAQVDVANFISGLLGVALGTSPAVVAERPSSPLADAKIFDLVNATITSAVDRISKNLSSEERVRFFCAKSQRFVWIMVSRLGEKKLLACTNDADMSIGQAPSFWHTNFTTDKESLVIAIVNHLSGALTGFEKLEVLHECSLADGHSND